MSRPSTPLMMSRNRTNSATSLQSVQSGTGNTCPHRGHTQLERLKTLKLASNRLTRIALTMSGVMGTDDRVESSSTESLHTTGSGAEVDA